MKLGPHTFIVLNDPAIIKDVFSRKKFLPRPEFWSIKQRKLVNNGASGKEQKPENWFFAICCFHRCCHRLGSSFIVPRFFFTGIVFSESEAWKEHRRFILHTLRDFGVGKFRTEEKILEEAEHLKTYLHKTNNQPIDTKIPISTAVANVIGNILTGVRYETNDPNFVNFLELNRQNFEFTWRRALIALVPWTKVVPTLKAKYEETIEMYKGLKEFFGSTVERHLKDWDPDRNHDFVESYISATKSGAYPSFSSKNTCNKKWEQFFGRLVHDLAFFILF